MKKQIFANYKLQLPDQEGVGTSRFSGGGNYDGVMRSQRAMSISS
ncbi:MAG: hypothetical protein WA949_09590 [Phormidesmis sp.]